MDQQTLRLAINDDNPGDYDLLTRQLREREVHVNAVFNLPGVGQVQLDAATGRILHANPQFCAMTGYHEAELQTLTPADITRPEEREADWAQLQRLLRGDIEHYVTEKRYIRKDGGILWAQVNAALVRDDDSQPHYTVAIIQDITERKQTEEALAASRDRERQFRQRLAALHTISLELANAPSVDELCRRAVERGRQALGFDRVGIFLLEAEPNIVRGTYGTDGNGMTRDERDWYGPARSEGLNRILLGGERFVFQPHAVNPSDRTNDACPHAMAALWDGERTIGVISTDNLLTGQPVTEEWRELVRLYATLIGHQISRHRTLLALSLSEERLRMAAQTIGFGVYDWHIQDNRLVWSDQLYHITGLDPAQPVKPGIPAHLVHPDDQKSHQDMVKRATDPAGPGQFDVEFRIVRADGQTRWVRDTGKTLFEGQGDTRRAVRVVGAFRDITARKQTEEQLRQSEARLTAFLEQLPVGVGMFDPQGRWIIRNPMLTRFVGDTIPSRDPKEVGRWRSWAADGSVVDPSQWPGARALRGEAINPGMDFLHTLKDGGEIWMRVSATPFYDRDGEIAGVISVIQDIDERKRAELNTQFLVELDRAIAQTADENGIAATALRLLGQFLGVTASGLIEIDQTQGGVSLQYEWSTGGQNIIERDAVAQILGSEVSAALEAGETVTVLDLPNDENNGLAADTERRYRPGAFAITPYLSVGRLVTILVVYATPPREWRPDELHLLRDVMTRLWPTIERRRAVAALVHEQELLQTIIDTIPVMITLYEPDKTVLRLNREFERLVGWSSQEALNNSLMEEIYPEPEYRKQVSRFMESGADSWMDIRMRTRDGQALETSWANRRLSDQTQVGIGIDITERKQAELNQTFMLEIAETIRRAEDADVLLAEVAQAVGQHLGLARCAFDEIDLTSGTGRVQYEYRAPGVAPGPDQWSVTSFSLASLDLIKAGHAIVVSDAKTDERTAALYESQYRPHGYAAYVAVPMMRDGRWVATLWVNQEEPHPWSQPELGLLEAVAERTWLAVERLRQDAALRASELRLRLATEAASLFAWDIDCTTNTIEWADNAVHILGVPAEWLSTDPKQADFFVYSDDLARCWNEYETALADGSHRYRLEFRSMNRVTGQTGWMLVHGLIVRDASGQPIRVYGVTQDITDRKLAEETLRRSEERFRLMANTTPAITWTADPTGAITFHNQRWLEYTGISPEENERDWATLVLHPDDFEPCIQAWTYALTHGTDYEIEVRNRRHDGEYRWFLTRATPIRDTEGRIVEWYGSSTDIHDRKQAEAALQEANRRKDEFLATLAHELRNPLAPIVNAVHLLTQKGQLDPSLPTARDIIDRQVRQMVRLVDDLLDVSRITRGKLDLRKERVNLATVVEQALETSRPHIEVAGHRFSLSLPSAPVYLHADPVRLAQVISNLLNNASKYTEPGGKIWLTAEREESGVSISVKDTGAGIPADQLVNVFEMFSQVDRSLERSQGGLGIGLTLVKRLVEMHGGTVKAHSDGPGQGSEFVVHLPTLMETSSAEPAAERPDATPPAATHRILIVDDSPDIVDSLAALLEMDGHETFMAYDGLEAIEVAEQVRPDVVLLDIGLPLLNGYEVGRRIREQPWGKPMLLVALTGWGQAEDRRLSREAGFDHHLVKPVDYNDLARLLETALAAKG